VPWPDPAHAAAAHAAAAHAAAAHADAGGRLLAEVLLGDDLLPFLLLALGGALVVGNGLALVRPPPTPKEGDLPRARVGRSLVMIAIGLTAAIWALATLTS
jgi:hypothetical protein